MLPPPAERVARLAPTPSGFLHAGNAVNFLVNAALAGPAGRLLLRIDDLDRGRFRTEYLEDIFATLDWLGIRPTDGPRDAADFAARWSQEHRMGDYRAALGELRHHPLVFACRCSRRELTTGDHVHGCRLGAVDPDSPGVAWRIDTRRLPQREVDFAFLAGGGRLYVDVHQRMPDFAIRQRNGRPSYQLACTVDDLRFGVNVCARGVDLLASTAAQSVLSDLLGYPPLFERCWFFHHPLLREATGRKLSKSAGAAALRAQRAEPSATPAALRALAQDYLRLVVRR